VAHTVSLPHVEEASVAPVIVTGQWRKLIMANYVVDPAKLFPYLPAKTSLNVWNGRCYVTLSAFTVEDVRVRGLRIPFHHDLKEVNLRFYVTPDGAGQDRRGVSFIQEITEKPLLAWGANLFYKEHYRVMPIEQTWDVYARKPEQRVRYSWQTDGYEFSMKVKAGRKPLRVIPGTEEHFITVQPFGYTTRGHDTAWQYRVEHPVWDMYEVEKYKVDVDFDTLFGKQFDFLNALTPSSVYLLEGSEMAIRMRQRL
jgi:uncharacterized protein